MPLKWHHPIGLLYDLYAGSTPAVASIAFGAPQTRNASALSSPLPWRLTIHYSSFPSDQLVQLDPDGKAMHDAYINSVKEADFLRNGTANAIMKLNTEDSTALWQAVVDRKCCPLPPHAFTNQYSKVHYPCSDNLTQFASIYNRLVPATSTLRHIPLRIYLPASDIGAPSSPDPASLSSIRSGHLRVVQALVQPFVPGTREQQTLGNALNVMIPALFPSRRRMVLARPVLHGAVLPLEAVLDDLMRGAVYADGWLSLGIDMIM